MLFFLFISLMLFVVGSFGMFLSRKHVIIVLISLELMLLSCTFNFIVSSIFYDDFFGQIYALVVLTVAACETAIGLAVLVVYYRLRGGIAIDLINLLKS